MNNRNLVKHIIFPLDIQNLTAINSCLPVCTWNEIHYPLPGVHGNIRTPIFNKCKPFFVQELLCDSLFWFLYLILILLQNYVNTFFIYFSPIIRFLYILFVWILFTIFLLMSRRRTMEVKVEAPPSNRWRATSSPRLWREPSEYFPVKTPVDFRHTFLIACIITIYVFVRSWTWGYVTRTVAPAKTLHKEN